MDYKGGYLVMQRGKKEGREQLKNEQNEIKIKFSTRQRGDPKHRAFGNSTPLFVLPCAPSDSTTCHVVF